MYRIAFTYYSGGGGLSRISPVARSDNYLQLMENWIALEALSVCRADLLDLESNRRGWLRNATPSATYSVFSVVGWRE